MNTAACRLDFELLSKLNQLELRNEVENNLESVVESLSVKLSSLPNSSQFSKPYLETILKWCPSRTASLMDLFSNQFSYLWSIPGPNSASKIKHSPQELLSFIDQFEVFLNKSTLPEHDISQFIKEYSSSNDLKFQVLMADLRLLLCGVQVSTMQAK